MASSSRSTGEEPRKEGRRMIHFPGVRTFRELTAHADRPLDRELIQERLLQLSSWAMVLGTVRLICSASDQVNALLDIQRSEPYSGRILARFFQENPPALLLGMAWP